MSKQPLGSLLPSLVPCPPAKHTVATLPCTVLGSHNYLLLNGKMEVESIEVVVLWFGLDTDGSMCYLKER